MSAYSYAEAISRLLASEGGYVNHPSDPGGPTNYGITIADYRRYMKPDATAADVRAMRVDEAKAIYREKYWRAMRCDELPAGVDYCAFDYAVNSGTGRVSKVLQRLLAISVSGRVDDATLAAAGKRESRALIQSICDERLRFLRGLKTWPVFGKGWSKRVGDVRLAALALADKSAGRTPLHDAPPPATAQGKGVVPLNDTARRSTTGGALASGGIAAQQSAANGVDWLVVAVIVLAAIAIAGGAWAFWRWHQKRRQDAPA
jgi:lysozyme family protein